MSKRRASKACNPGAGVALGRGRGENVRPSTNHGLSTQRPRFSHEHHVDLEKTLLNDSVMDEIRKDEAIDDDEDNEPQDDNDNDEDTMFTWDSEQSLLWDLMDDGPHNPSPSHLLTLIDSLSTPFLEQRKHLKTEMAETFVPVMKHMASLHRSLAETVDAPYAKGLKAFNDACKEVEGASLREYEEMVEGYEEVRGNIASLIDQLKAEYDARELLWANVQAQINDLADTALTSIQDTPAQVERTIAKLDRVYQNQVEDKKEGAGVSERRLKELLSKLG